MKIDNPTEPVPWSFEAYAEETISDYTKRDQFGKQLLRHQIKEKIQHYQDLLKSFDDLDKNDQL